MIRRTIHPETRMLDEKNGIVQYVASDETLDSYREVIRADGWKFDEFEKNAPFVDSHNYYSLENQVGKVIDYKVQGKQLVETVKWAIDVPENKLAQLGFAMTRGGYLKAVSVGFVPTKMTSRWDRDPQGHEEACKELGLDPKKCNAIYQEQQQKELSACIIGANPNALAKAYKAGVIDDSAVEFLGNECEARFEFTMKRYAAAVLEECNDFSANRQTSKRSSDRFDKYREELGAGKVDDLLASLGLGPKYVPVIPLKIKCGKCGAENGYWKEFGGDCDAGQNYMAIYCPDCGFTAETQKEFLDQKRIKETDDRADGLAAARSSRQRAAIEFLSKFEKAVKAF